MSVRQGGPDDSPDPGRIGGKAANLARLEAAGATVPTWLVIPVDAVAAATATPTPGPATGSDLRAELRAELRAGLAAAGLVDSLLAVRSSAVGEDAEGASFAGQFETVLGVPARDLAAVDAAVERVLASASSDRVRAYAGSGGPPPMAVILQVLVDASASGVAFSADPVTGAEDHVVVSAVRGLGEALVSGEVDADTFRLRAEEDAGGVGDGPPALRVVERTVAEQDRALRRTERGTAWVELDGADRASPSITDAEALEIGAVVRALARRLGSPQDVEWALEGEGEDRRLVILQTRPITTLIGERRVWDNSNIVESYAGVTTPLTFSFARGVYEDVYRQFCRVMGVDDALIERNGDVFRNMIGLVRGRVYYNLLNWYRVLAMLPGYVFNRAFMERMMGVREELADPPDPPRAADRWHDLGRMLRMVWRMLRASRRLRHTVPAFHRRLDDALDPLADEDLTRWSPDRLVALYRRLEDQLLRHWRPPLVNDFFAMIWFGVLGRLTERWLPDHPQTRVNDLLAGVGGMISSEPARRVMALAGRVAADPALRDLFELDDGEVLRRLRSPGPDGPIARFAAELDQYLRRFGDRCANELKLETVTLSEDPTFLVSTIRSYVRQGVTDPDASRAREEGIRDDAERAVARQLRGVKLQLYRAVLRRARGRIRDRENLRFERTRVFGVVRRIFLGLGHGLARADRLGDPRDVFWLTSDEVFGWAEGTAVATDLRSAVRRRREEFRAYEDGPAPPERFETRGPPADAVLRAAAAPESAGASAGASAGESSGEAEGAGLAGIGCCAGVVRAPVRRVLDPREAGDLGGHILVAERTDPGWTLLFPSASGILVQRGSLLSHSAIVAREMGIPCVVSIPGLMDTLEDGEVVEMDGTTGAIRRVAEGVP